jgi:DNA-binding protein HU-beta
MAKARRTIHRSRTGTKLYAVRDSKGRFKDIQTYKRAHGADLRQTSKSEAAAKKKRASQKGTKKAARKRTAKRRARR